MSEIKKNYCSNRCACSRSISIPSKATNLTGEILHGEYTKRLRRGKTRKKNWMAPGSTKGRRSPAREDVSSEADGAFYSGTFGSGGAPIAASICCLPDHRKFALRGRDLELAYIRWKFTIVSGLIISKSKP